MITLVSAQCNAGHWTEPCLSTWYRRAARCHEILVLPTNRHRPAQQTWQL